jgi:hypothetical protein
MGDTRLLQVTERSWIVKRNDEPEGILNRDVQDHYVFIGGRSVCIQFDSDQDVAQHFGNTHLFEQQETISTEADKRYYVMGFEVDVDEPVIIDEDDVRAVDGLPLYAKTQGSDVLYAAGYYAVNFPRGWTGGHNVKLSTLQKYGYSGPFRNRDDMKREIKKLNAKRKAN